MEILTKPNDPKAREQLTTDTHTQTFRLPKVVLYALRDVANTTGMTQGDLLRLGLYLVFQKIDKMLDPRFQLPYDITLSRIWENYLANSLSGDPEADRKRDEELEAVNKAATQFLEG
jgi:hypothetical protein